MNWLIDYSWQRTLSLFLQVRSSLFELARKTKFDLCRHVVVTFVLLVIINLLVIFIPTMKDIFGVVGTVSWFCTTKKRLLLISNTIISCCWQLTNLIYLNFAGVTSANMLIFILPSSLYLKITQQDGSKLTQRIWVCIPFPSTQRFRLVIPYNVLDAKRT